MPAAKKKKASPQDASKPAGQRAISSFFHRKQQPSASQQEPSRQAAQPEAPPALINLEDDDQPASRPSKRARYFENERGSDSPAAGAEEPPAQPSRPVQRQAGMHQRFQNKLVLGTGNRKAGTDRDSIVPQKHTPLELQVQPAGCVLHRLNADTEQSPAAGGSTEAEAPWRVAGHRSGLCALLLLLQAVPETGPNRI